ncbi:MAG TPA: HAD-IC family P-type ATPase [Anaerolineae bacterium]|jgi:cation-transporting ATPase E|nr:HAD-IC family P-type ATPase [Anaerolineae bacterium]
MNHVLSLNLGLTEKEATARRARGQGNDLKLQSSRPYRQILRDNLLTFFNIVLFGVSLVLLLLGSPRDAFFTAGVAVLNVIIATIQEVRAKRKLDQISLLTRPKVKVIRDGREKEIDPGEIVLADVLVVEPGDQIVVDGEVIGDGHMDVDESLLTGESDLIHKHAGDTVLSGSFCVVGRATYQVQKVGRDSFANRLTEGARTFTGEKTPLQREVDLIIRVLLLVVIFFAIMLALSLVVNEEATLLESVRATSVVIGLAPSSLFLTIVVAYALGALRIANKGALVQQANSVESLCHVSVLCLDKTGTLTSNRIKLEQVQVLDSADFDPEELNDVLGLFAHSVSVGNRTSDALAKSFSGRQESFREEVPFSSSWKWSALSFTTSALPGTYILGAPEVLRAKSQPESNLELTVEHWSAGGLRVLLFAYRPDIISLHDSAGDPRLPDQLRPLALLGFSDELRPEARKTLEGFARAGIELKIISGDNPRTVAAIARQAGLGGDAVSSAMISGPELEELDQAQFKQAALDKSIFGRITPDQKQRLVRVLRDSDHYVAMTGDGVNDVLALKQANLGVAMQSGSQASRSVSDIILLNDSFAALPEAFIEGQRILNGMEDIFRLYMTRIFSLVLLIAMIAMLAAGFPFTPSQSSIISLLTLSIPAFALALWARPGPVRQGSLTRRLVHFVLPAAITMSAAGLSVYLFFVVSTGDTAYGQLSLTYAMMAMGLLLIIFVEPPSEFWVGGDTLSGDWRPTLLALVIFASFFLALTVEPIQEFYGLTPLHSAIDYFIVGLVTLIWVVIVRFTWRRGIIDRYLNLSSLRDFI